MSEHSFHWPAGRNSKSQGTAQEIAAIRARINERPVVIPVHAIPGVMTGRVNQIRRPFLDSFPSPLGTPGARLWVKEPWQSRFTVDGGALTTLHDWQKSYRDCFYEALDPFESSARGLPVTRWRDPIRMPRWASRVLLEVLSVETPPLQAMKDADAIACGVKIIDGPLGQRYENAKFPDDYANAYEFPVNAFASFWDESYGDASWSRNPLVHVTTFKCVSRHAN